MVEPFLSSDWYRVAALRPRLRGHVDVHRQTFRGDVWYVVQDNHSGRYHRLPPLANYLLSLMDGRRSMQSIWEAACDRFSDEPPSQRETIRLLSQLHGADLIAGDFPPDLEELGRRHALQARRELLGRFKNPMAIKLPLFDPDRFLTATLPLVRWLFTPVGFILWLMLTVTGVVLTIVNWDEMTGGLADRVLSAENLILLVVAYPMVKLVHELGHGYAAKSFGGVVHEVGVMFLVFIPVPYVDASSSAAFPSKWRRAVVGGAGIMVEVALAVLALLVWLTAEPGLVRALAFNVMLIGGVSTLLFNGNPLLRFDGYFVLADLIEIPNLGQRSNRYVWYLFKRAFGVKGAKSPVTAPGEAKWLFTYSIAAFLYRVFISFAIALFVATQFFFVGVILAIWALSATFVVPVIKGARYLLTGVELRATRGRAIALTTVVLGGLGAAIFLVPLPWATTVHGVVWLEPRAQLRLQTAGFVAEAVVADMPVTPGTVLLRAEDPGLDSRLELQRLELQEAELRLAAVDLGDRVQGRILSERADLLRDRIAETEARRARLTVDAPIAGHAVLPGAKDLPGRRLERGALVGYILSDAPLRLRVAVSEGRADLVRNRTRNVTVRLLSDVMTEIPGRVAGEVPQSQNVLPSAALAREGGGDVVLNPAASQPLTALRPVFLFDVSLESDHTAQRVGERALVRFDHGSAPLSMRLERLLRSVFLRQFDL